MWPRGIRTNNPGNLRIGIDWDGLADEMPRILKREKTFCVFRAPQWGVRAMAKVLLTYKRKYGINRMSTVIDRWAPPTENDTQSYIRSAALFSGIDPDAEIDLGSYAIAKELIRAIIRHENGVDPYPDHVIDRGLELAGFELPHDFYYADET